MNRRIALGTVQFGLHYGVANHTGQPSLDEVQAILTTAQEKGIGMLDTAIAYGASEQILGQLGIRDFEVVSKLPALPIGCDDVLSWVRAQVADSLHRLRLPQLRGILLHQPEQLMGPFGSELYDALQSLKDLGLVAKIGISIYRPDELDTLLKSMSFDLVQAPFNLLDRRLITTGWLDRLRGMGVEIHVRSVFLQGLLLMPAGHRPLYFDRWSKLWQIYDDWLRHHRITAVQACLRYALWSKGIDRLIVGVETSAQLLEVLAAAHGELPPLPEGLNCEDADLLNPASWRL